MEKLRCAEIRQCTQGYQAKWQNEVQTQFLLNLKCFLLHTVCHQQRNRLVPETDQDIGGSTRPVCFIHSFDKYVLSAICVSDIKEHIQFTKQWSRARWIRSKRSQKGTEVQVHHISTRCIDWSRGGKKGPLGTGHRLTKDCKGHRLTLTCQMCLFLRGNLKITFSIPNFLVTTLVWIFFSK